MTDAFVCYGNLKGQTVLLVDDTITTGSTMVACTKALKKAGALQISPHTACSMPNVLNTQASFYLSSATQTATTAFFALTKSSIFA